MSENFQQVTQYCFVDKTREFLESDQRYICEELAQELDLSIVTDHIIIRNRLGLPKVSVFWYYII